MDGILKLLKRNINGNCLQYVTVNLPLIKLKLNEDGNENIELDNIFVADK